MQSKIDEIKKLAEEKISKIKNSQDLQELKVQFLGKKSELSNLLKGLGALTAEERPKVGALVNEARKEIEEKLEKDHYVLIKIHPFKALDCKTITKNLVIGI